MHRKALGRGLEALIPGAGPGTAPSVVATAAEPAKAVVPPGETIRMLPIDHVGANPFQPRTRFDDSSLKELADSIRSTGILQPVIVRRLEADSFELVAGERRLRAARVAGLSDVPAIVRELDDREMMELALVENVQREDLNPIDEAKGYQALIQKVGLTHDQISGRVGKNRTTVTNGLRLLRLPEEILGYLKEGRLSAGHARALLGLFTGEQQIQLGRRILKENFSVRQVEELVARSARKRRARPARRLTPEVADLETRLSRHFGIPVRVFTSKNGQQGRIVVHYFSLDELDRFLSLANLPAG